MTRATRVSQLQIAEVMGEVLAALEGTGVCVLAAPPGAGKTTGVPLALLGAPWLGDRRIVMAEPRRVAARMAATRMAQLCGEPVGPTIGYRMRDDTKVTATTRIEVVTDGVMTRMLQSDLGLERYGAVVLDEFHERHLETDLALAFTIETMRELRPDLRLVVMSATLDTSRVVATIESALGRAVGLVEAAGRTFAVEVRYAPPPTGTAMERATAEAVRTTLGQSDGDVLVFLPGVAEIRRAARLIGHFAAHTEVLGLHGAMSSAEQDEVVRGRSGRKRVILATALAQTSVTINGVTTVIDSGWARHARYDAHSGLTRLVTERVTSATADQRAGRAGRTSPGVCIRLWSDRERLALHDRPDIITADLSGLALQLARWGDADTTTLTFVDPPDPDALRTARTLLERLSALDTEGRITSEGEAMAALALDVRLAHLLLSVPASDIGAASLIAALLQEGDPWRGEGADLARRLSALQADSSHDALEAANPALLRRVRTAAARFESAARRARPRHPERHATGAGPGPGRPTAPGVDGQSSAGALLAIAYPDRLAARQGTVYRFAGGAQARLPPDDLMAGSATLVIADLDGDRRDGRIWLAASIRPDEIADRYLVDRAIVVEPVVGATRLAAVERLHVDGLVVDERRIIDESEVPPAARSAATIALLARDGLDVALGGSRSAEMLERLRVRLRLCRRVDSNGNWPDPETDAIAADIAMWVVRPTLARPFGPDPAAQIADRLDDRRLPDVAPASITLGSATCTIDYGDGTGAPRLAVRLQRVLGVAIHPTVAHGRVAVVVELLSPADRPIATTADLPGFWRTGYNEVRKQLRGRYPKHRWPEDPLS